MLRVRYLLLTLCFGLLAVLQAHSQMKIGNHPTTIHPASILELESNKQALRLTQGDTSDVNTVIGTDTHADKYQAAEGMIMYNTADSSVYMRTQGTWRKVVSLNDVDSTFWKLTGNRGTDSATSFLGTLDQTPLNLGAGGSKYIIIHSGGRVDVLGDSLFVANNAGFGKSVTIADSLNVGNGALDVRKDTVYFGKPMVIQDSIVIRALSNALSTDTSLLVIGAGGVVRKISMDSIGIRGINGIAGTYIHLKFDTVSAGHNGPWIDSTSQAGLSTLILNIPDASPTVRGLVSDTAQAFAGVKSFGDSVAVGTISAPTATLDVQGNINLKTAFIGSPADYNMSTTPADANYRTIIFDVTSIATATYTVTLPTPVAGRIYTIKKVGKSDDPQLGANLNIVPSGGATFEDGGTALPIYNNFSSVTLQAQNNKWYIIQ